MVALFPRVGVVSRVLVRLRDFLLHVPRPQHVARVLANLLRCGVAAACPADPGAGYMLIVSWLFFLLTGVCGFVPSFIFVHKIYSAIKVD